MERLLKICIMLSVLVFFLFSCGNKKKEVTAQADDVTVVVDTIPDVVEDTLLIEEEFQAEEPAHVDEFFEDFIFHFASDDEFQRKRTVFPLPYYKEDTPLKIEKEEWQHDSLFVKPYYYTLLFDEEDEMELLSDGSQTSIQLEWIFMETKQMKRYYFERIEGRWMLEAINLRPMPDNHKADFIDFFVSFAADSLYQEAHVTNPLEFITTDPDDDFSILETVIERSQWFAFKPELPKEKLSNINYGQKNEENSSTKIVQIKGIGNGFLNTLFFRKRQAKWELYKFEDTSN